MPKKSIELHSLQTAFDQLIEKVLSKDFLLTEYVVHKLKQVGHVITDVQKEYIRQQIQSGPVQDRIIIEGIESENIALTQVDIDNLRNLLHDLEEDLEKLYQDTVDHASEVTLANCLNELPAELQQQNRVRRRFEKQLQGLWGDPLGLLEMALILATEMGDRVNDELRAEAADNNDLVFEVLARLHARACQISYEILTLLKAGYADGAMARWRSLYELVIVACFIQEKGQATAQSYIDHCAVSRYKGANTMQACHKISGITPLSAQEYNAIKREYDSVKQQYGPAFVETDYGWAASILDNNRPNLSHLEDQIELKQLRPHTKMAHQNVHAGAMRMYNSLGIDGLEDDRLLTGPSMLGLSLPIQLTATSMTHITILFQNLKDTLDNHYRGQMLINLRESIQQATIRANK